MGRDAGSRDESAGGGVGVSREMREGEFDGEEVGGGGRDAEGAEGLGDLFENQLNWYSGSGERGEL